MKDLIGLLNWFLIIECIDFNILKDYEFTLKIKLNILRAITL